ncbi:hypothetical protein ABZ547_02340 [Streptomyces sparsogenes]|uniref:hypothetical protein n=1 Tax=Streptomyces sparsogenes TaxID=67365 RepID=UPI0033D8004E
MSEHFPSDLPLPQATAAPYTRSRPLPPYRGIVAVDAKDFTGYPAIEHDVISRAIPELLRTSFERSGIAELWDDRRFPDSTGDGFVLGFDPTAMPFVIHPWLSTLQDVLTEFNVHSMGAVRIRLRVSLHIGPVTDSGEREDGKGTPRNDTHRLLDSRPVKAMLAASSENVTWLYVPAPSGTLYDRRILGDQVIDDQEARGAYDGGPRPLAHATAPRTLTNRADNGNVNTGTVHGGQKVSNTHVAGDHFGGSKAGTVHGNQGDTVRGNKNSGHR